MVAVDGMVNPKPVQVRELEFPTVGNAVLADKGNAPGVVQGKTPPPMSADMVATFVSVAI
jgi:hypothetical protein